MKSTETSSSVSKIS